MNPFQTRTVLSAILSLLFATAAAAAVETRDPNAALRKATSTPGDRALAEFERVKKTNNELAIQHFTGVIAKTPNDAAIYAKRGKAYAALRDYANAVKDYDKAIQLDPKNTDAYVNRAVSRFMVKDYDGSWEDVHKAESLGGKFWPAFMDALKESSKRKK